MALPRPEVGQVIRYVYLWHRQDMAGREDGEKARPCAIVVAIAPAGPQQTGESVAVVPITHSPPADPRHAIELPADVKRQLGLDGDRSWLVLDEINRFVWPGPDLASDGSSFVYGTLPNALTGRMLRTLATLIRAKRLKVVMRTE